MTDSFDNLLRQMETGPQGDQPAKNRLVVGIVRGITETFRTHKAKREALETRVNALERRIAELEQRSAVPYKGVWDDRTMYQRGEFVTFGGSMWYANEPSINARPGNPGAIWSLCVKKGRDGKDAR